MASCQPLSLCPREAEVHSAVEVMPFAASQSRPQPAADGTMGTCTCSCAPHWDNSELGCFALLPRASPTGLCSSGHREPASNAPSLAIFPSRLLSPCLLQGSLQPSSTETTCRRLVSWRRLLEEVNTAEEDCIGSRNGKPGFRNGLTRGSSDAQPPPLLSGLPPLIWLCPLFSSCPQT